VTLHVRRYAADERARWDAFVDGAKNATFLFRRDYMEYHADRFADHSLVVTDGEGGTVALLPADRRDDVVRSHGGLTYGGFVVDAAMTLPLMGEVFDATAAALRADGVRRVVYKTVPRIYHALPADEDAYWLFRTGARLFRRDVLTVLEYDRRAPAQERRMRTLRKARRSGLAARETDDWAGFWAILAANLQERYGVAPVHAEAEIRQLAAAFPEAIRLVGTYEGDRLLAGAVAYVSRDVCHVQYNAASAEGKRAGARDLARDVRRESYAGRVRYFDFGASTEDGGRTLNAGLVEYKEGFGARTVVHDMYEWTLDAPEAA
jgi:hypothetical protein